MTRVGRRFVGPTAELEEYLDPTDPTAPAETVIVLAERYRKLTSLRVAMEVGRSFLERPLVPGLAPLTRMDVDAGRYSYLTGEVWTLAEIMQEGRKRAGGLGERAAVEVGWLVGTALVEAAEAGETAGIVCHGDVSPWRITLRPDGELLIIGYGLPDPEWLRMRHTGAEVPMEPSFRYAPPERAAGRPEDIHSDLFGLALLVAELATGAPVYGGTIAEMWAASRTGAAMGSAAISRVKQPLRDHLLPMLEPAPGARPSADAWCAGFAHLAARDPAGPSIAEIAAEQAQSQDRRDLRPAAEPLREANPTRLHHLASLLDSLRAE
ncbi:MAG TPA: hypothetical protein PKA64_07045, partial [Myxococcota bacterium]|nr:hypothetical protein [Myxococcota bacterium]